MPESTLRLSPASMSQMLTMHVWVICYIAYTTTELPIYIPSGLEIGRATIIYRSLLKKTCLITKFAA